ncbi:MAG: GNAT family N-acetyltransferase [Candidatus Kapaibacterium sp.]
MNIHTRHPMNIHAYTERLILRDAELSDVEDWFEMDADPEVHRYIDNSPVTSKDEIEKVIGMVRQQYADVGIGRWSVVDRTTGECVGWAGLKRCAGPVNGHYDFMDLGYRFKRKHWGKGYATESSRAALETCLDRFASSLPLHTVYAITDVRNDASKHVLLKLGFTLQSTFLYDGLDADWFELPCADRR